MTSKKHFEINWPLGSLKKSWNFRIWSGHWLFQNTCNSNSSSFNLDVRNTSTFIDELVTSDPSTVLPGLCFRKTSHFHVPDFSNPMLRIFIPHSPFSRVGNWRIWGIWIGQFYFRQILGNQSHVGNVQTSKLIFV